MLNTTLCYIERGDEYLMLHRVKKKNDINKDKWIGLGGKFEEDESPEECLLREVYEESGLTLVEIQRHRNLREHAVRVGIYASVHGGRV